MTKLSRAGALVQSVAVVAGLLGWVIASNALGAGIFAAHPLAPLVHAGLTGAVALGMVGLATMGDESRVEVLGLSKPAWGPTLLFALLGAFGAYAASAILSLGFVLVRGADRAIEDKTRAMAMLGDVPLWAIVPIALFAGFYEEIVFRGFLLGRLRIVFGETRSGVIAAVLVSSVLFAGGHAYQGWIGVAQTFAAGACFAAVVAIRRSLWPSIVAHAAIDSFGLFALHVLKPQLEKMLQEQRLHG